MSHQSHRYQIRFHCRPAPGEPFRWQISDPVEVTALTAVTAERLARHLTGVDNNWQVRECLDLGQAA